MSNPTHIIFYGLSTCIHCKRVHAFLDDLSVHYETHFVDLATGEERADLLRKVQKLNPRLSFPTVLIGSTVIVGEDYDGLRTALDGLVESFPLHKAGERGVPGNVAKILDHMAPIQEKIGYFFNKDKNLTVDLMEQLLARKQKLGYMACPCRLASGKYEEDKDIICPCQYRAEDVLDYGVCFCGLYVGEEWKGKPLTGFSIPERREPEKVYDKKELV